MINSGTAPLSGEGPLIRAQNFGKIEHIHQIMQLYLNSQKPEDLTALRDTKYLRDVILTRSIVTEVVLSSSCAGRSQRVDFLLMLMGRILQIQEQNETGKEVEAEIQHLANIALDCLGQASGDTEIRAAQDVVRSLPARTTGEIQFVWQVVDGTTDSRVHVACEEALLVARPKNEEAWRELEKGKASSVGKVREAVEMVTKYNK